MPLIHQWVWDSVLSGPIRDVSGSAYAHDGDWCGVSGTDWTNDGRSYLWKEPPDGDGNHPEQFIAHAASIEMAEPVKTPAGDGIFEGVDVQVQHFIGNTEAFDSFVLGVFEYILIIIIECMASVGWSASGGTWTPHVAAAQTCFNTDFLAYVTGKLASQPGYNNSKVHDDEAFSAELPYDLPDIWNFSFFAFFAYDGKYMGSQGWLTLRDVMIDEINAILANFVSTFGAPPGWPPLSVFEAWAEDEFGGFVYNSLASALVDNGVVAGDAFGLGAGPGTQAWQGWQIIVGTWGCNLEFYVGDPAGPVRLPLGKAGFQPGVSGTIDDGGPKWSRVGWRIETPDGWSSGTVSLGYDWEGVWGEGTTYPKDAVVRKWTHYYKSLVNDNGQDPAPILVSPDITSGTCTDVLQDAAARAAWELFTPLEVPEPTVTTFVDDCAVYIIGASQAGWLAGTPGFPVARDGFSVGYHNDASVLDLTAKYPLCGSIGEVAIWSGPRALGIDRRIGLRFPP